MIIRWLFNDYLMIIWYYCVYLSYLINIWKNMQSEWLTQFCICQAILLLNSCGQACLSSEGNLWFAWFITAKRPPRISMSAVRMIWLQGGKFCPAVRGETHDPASVHCTFINLMKVLNEGTLFFLVSASKHFMFWCCSCDERNMVCTYKYLHENQYVTYLIH